MRHWRETFVRRLPRHPLCDRYLAIFLGAQTVHVQEGSAVLGKAARWALGVLADGQHEMVGVWLETRSNVLSRQEVFDDLKLRGVREIRFVVSSEAGQLRADKWARYFDAEVLSLPGRYMRQSPEQSAPRRHSFGADDLGRLRASVTGEAARAALADLTSSSWGAANPDVVARLGAALTQLAPYYALQPRLRRLLLAEDESARWVPARR